MILNNGVPVVIDWKKMVVGSSFYIPTLEPLPLYRRIEGVGEKYGFKILFKTARENGTQGIRVWRVS